MSLLGHRAALGTLLFLLGLTTRAEADTYVDDPLTSPTAPGRGSKGGSFGPNGFTTSAPSDSVWYEMPEALPSGRVEYTVTGLSLQTSLIEADNDIFTLYQAPTGETEPIPYWPWRNNDFKVFTRIFGTKEVDRPGAMKLELAGCPRGEPWWHDEPCPDQCDSISGIAYANGNQNDVGWDANASYRMALEWGNGDMTFFRDGTKLGTVSYPGTFAPKPMRVRIGTPRDDIPVGITVRDLLVTGTPGAMTAICQVASTPPNDAGVEPPPAGCDPYIEAVSLSPSTGSGPSALFEATYRHCQGASSFRIVQLWVGESVAPGVPSVHLAYEAGQFHLEGKSCSPGESTKLPSPMGTLDCALSSAEPNGNDLLVKWSVTFDTSAFAGERGVFFDAKGPASMTPEPRLGWTRMGTFTVSADPPQTIPPSDAGIDASPNLKPRGGTTSDEGGCGCKLGGRRQPGESNVLALFAALAGLLIARARR